MMKRILNKLFGVKWSTYEAKCAELAELQRIHEAVAKAKSGETRGKLQFESLYNAEKERVANLQGQLDQKTENNDTLVGINRSIGQEIARIRDLFLTPFVSAEARKLALDSREVWARHLQKPSGLKGKYTSKDVTLAVTIARQEQQRKEDDQKLAERMMAEGPYPGKDAAPPPGMPMPPEEEPDPLESERMRKALEDAVAAREGAAGLFADE